MTRADLINNKRKTSKLDTLPKEYSGMYDGFEEIELRRGKFINLPGGLYVFGESTIEVEYRGCESPFERIGAGSGD